VQPASASSNTPPQREEGGARQAQGWYTWYFDNGINLLFWRRMASGHIIGIELDHARLLADIIARLPDTTPGDGALSGGGIELLDSDGVAIYQWGGYKRGEKEAPRAELAASSPLSSWRLKYYMPSADLDAALRGGRTFGLYGALAALGLALLGLAYYFYREHSRDVRLAAQRVNFVNRVSHELKTPLTNIRLYAELLETQFETSHAAGEEHATSLRRYLNVIVTESQRLSRLISNVLLFGRQQKQAHVLHPSPGVVDDCVAATLEQFRPSLESKGIVARHASGAPASVFFDTDAVGQILGNLFSNVEKYAASGGWLEVATTQREGNTEVLVSDRGGGVPAAYRDKIFEPFYRISDSLSDGVAGTGIGLTIARELARLHGGDLTFDAARAEQNGGATFRLVLRTPPVRTADAPSALPRRDSMEEIRA
jgi:signal transduction histidine kinase